ncbi:Crp/Fnr family transcriptional regulator [Tolypothrix sp. NIES-4075]|uniref:Crp/Fnr family transcriptional regulator n=1 Tax=Tolypothrix sp. NIES-4075 TaxID=2005459 RepID=UPI000B5C9B0F|nr:Crp/Fnr family transcriptional regulator [Tolypothrix sp. NIES-4075]
MLVTKNPDLPRNKLLAALPDEDYQRLVPDLEFVELPIKQVLYEPEEPIKHVYFVNQGIVSIVYTTEDGSTVEVGMVGNEGMVGIPVFLGGNMTTTTAFVQVPGNAMRMNAVRLKAEFDLGGSLQKSLLLYTQALLTQITHTAVSNRLNTVEERLARWLLMVADLTQSDEFPLTQEFIAQMLGVRRSGVTVAAGILSQAGMIRYSRGRITILNREGLEATSGESYRVIKREFSRLFDTERA